MIEAGIKVFAVLVVVVSWVVMYGVPVVYVVRTGRFWRGVFYCWCLQILVIMFVSVVLTGVLFTLLPEQKDVILDSFPEAPGVAGAIVTGWLPGLVFSGVGLGIHRWRKRRAIRTTGGGGMLG